MQRIETGQRGKLEKEKNKRVGKNQGREGGEGSGSKTLPALKMEEDRVEVGKA